VRYLTGDLPGANGALNRSLEIYTRLGMASDTRSAQERLDGVDKRNER
jgi:hypothetical protein